MNIVITGNIGCGKSTFTQMLAEQLPTHTIFDVDARIHGLYSIPAFCKMLQDRFGVSDRPAISDIVFKDERSLRWLEQRTRDFLKPYIIEAIRDGKTIFDFPLYYEEGMMNDFAAVPHVVVGIHCSMETQRERIAERGRFTEDKADAIISQQYSHALKAHLSDYPVSTDGTLVEMTEHAASIARFVKIQQLEERFLSIIPSQEAWNNLKQQYTQQSRHYHGIDHLIATFALYDKIEKNIGNRISVQLAIFYHDYVYDAYEGYANNEPLSAKALWSDLLKFAPHMIDRFGTAQNAVEMILATQGHRITSPYVLNKDGLLSDCQHFLDIDLSGLGMASIEEALATDNQIRKEFAKYTNQAFAEGRIKAMSSFVERPQLFQSDILKHLEAQAKINLAHIIGRYKSQLER